MSDNRATRAIAQFACPTCKAIAGAPCVDRENKPLQSAHGPGIHPLRRKLLSIGTQQTLGGWGHDKK